MKHAGIMGIVLVAVSVMATSVISAPKPVSVQRGSQWTLDVRYSQPRQMVVQIPGQAEPQRFWYIILSLTNNTTQEEISLVPACQLATDTFKILPAGKGVSKVVFEKIKAKHEGQYPFLESMDFEDMRLRKGADNTRDIAIIWPEFDPAAKQAHLFIAGLSNETSVIDDPVKKDDSGKPIRVYLQKTLQLTYTNSTDPQLRDQAGLTFLKQEWVMR